MSSKWRPGSFFIPAQNSRHRTACLALYRALLNASPKVPLPDDLATAWGTKRHPIAHVIRRAFLKNRNDTSSRLVYPALKAGYRMLDTLSRATDTATPEYASILTFLRKRLAQRDHVLLMKDLHPPNSKNPPKPSSAPHPNTVPLLINTTPAPTHENPNPKPTYASAVRPRPLADLPPGKKRKIPVLDMARDYPFLRLGKPQPLVLNRVMTQKNNTRTKRMDMIRDWNDDDATIIGVADCAEEDAWDEIVVDLIDQELLSPVIKAKRKGKRHDLLAREETREKFMRAVEEVEDLSEASFRNGRKSLTFKDTLRIHGLEWTMDTLQRDRDDAVARANAMRQIIADEKALAAQEKEQDRVERRKRWEARMVLEHGPDWEKIIAEEKRKRDDDRAARMRTPTRSIYSSC